MSSRSDGSHEQQIAELYGLLESYGLDADELVANATQGMLGSIAYFVQVTKLIENQPVAYNQTTEYLRLYFFGQLWSSDRLSPPWIQLIDRVFPGRLLTVEDLGRFISGEAEEILAWQETYENLARAVDLLAALLEHYEYQPADSDLEICETLTELLVFFWHANQRYCEIWPIEQQLESFQSKAMEAITGSSDPGHEVWPHILDLFKTAPQEQR